MNDQLTSNMPLLAVMEGGEEGRLRMRCSVSRRMEGEVETSVVLRLSLVKRIDSFDSHIIY